MQNQYSKLDLGKFKVLQDSIASLSPGRPKMRRFRSIDPTAMYFASGPNFTDVILPETKLECSEDQLLNLLKTQE